MLKIWQNIIIIEKEDCNMKKKREIFEKRSEILTKKLLSKIYAMEADFLESQMKASKNLNKLSEQANDWKDQLSNLYEEREKLKKLHQNMVDATEGKWQEAASAFEEYAEKINAEKQNYYERVQGWLDDLGAWINDLEDRTQGTSDKFQSQMQNQVDHLKKQQENLRKKSTDLQNYTGESWNKVYSGITQELSTMKTTLNNAYQNLIPQRKSNKDTSE